MTGKTEKLLRPLPRQGSAKLAIVIATDTDKETIYRLRHRVYAQELAQHRENQDQRLSDTLDSSNTYIVAKLAGDIVGFISITQPGGPCYSMDKYVSRSDLPFPFDDKLYEIRLLTVVHSCRSSEIASILMYAAFRWVESHGGARIMAIGRLEVLTLYLKVGLRPVGIRIQSGAVRFEAMTATVADLRQHLIHHLPVLQKFKGRIDWRLGIPFDKPAPCFHGGAFFDAIGDDFRSLDRKSQIINADVLDAWFPPSPNILSTLQKHLPWVLGTSPPTGSEGLIKTIAETRGVAPDCLLAGGGSSDLIFLALRQWLTCSSRVLILDPTYGEYAHVLEKVIGCKVDRLRLHRSEGYRLYPKALQSYFNTGYDLIVLVNPNSPTGRHLGREELEPILRSAPRQTRIWIDETYIEYAGIGQTMEVFAAQSENVIVCKSMSKVYALSGARVAYLCAPQHLLEELRSITPPWAIGLPAQIAAVLALQDPEYYAMRYQETHRLREELTDELLRLNLEVIPSVANFILCHLAPGGPDAITVCERSRAEGLFLRNAAPMGTQVGTDALRIAVKDKATNRRMIEILNRALSGPAEKS